jgi:hypothetical protein
MALDAEAHVPGALLGDDPPGTACHLGQLTAIVQPR